jgi:ubiquinone/menaquinone biosynthesis C-methylase UbiE
MNEENKSSGPDNYTRQVKDVLDTWYAQTVDGVHFSHQPIYGYRTPYAAPSNIARYMVTRSVLNALGRFSFNSFVDIGGAEGYTANLVRTLFKVAVQSTDLSGYACRMAREIFNIPATPCDIHRLPFENDAFDAVLCSETIEHVTDYKKAVQELLRITRNVLVITVPHESPELVAENIRLKIPHAHIHYFDIHTLDYLKDQGYTVTCTKTLCPLLVVPRVMAEGHTKPAANWKYKLYNRLTPLFRKLYGIRTANRLTNIDAALAGLTGLYGGITFTIVKPGAEKRTPHVVFRSRDFTGIKVPLYKPHAHSYSASQGF